MNGISIDTAQPASMAHLVDARETAVLQHGGVCTRINFSKVEAMDLAEFIRSEVPSLSTAQGSLFTIRNSAGGSFIMLLGDQVLKYTTTSVDEVPLDAMAELFVCSEDEVLTPDIPYPIIMRKVKNGYVDLTVRVQSCQRKLSQAAASHSSSCPVLSARYYPPDVWFHISLNQAGVVMGAAVAVEAERGLRWRDSVLRRWPLPNVFPGGAICFGQTSVDMSRDARMSEAEVLQYTLVRFFESTYNMDLVPDGSFLSKLLGQDHPDAGSEPDFAKIMAANSHDAARSAMLRVESVLTRPDAWRTLHWDAMDRLDTEEFCTCERH